MGQRLLSKIALASLCWCVGALQATEEKVFPRPSTAEVLYYHMARRLDVICAKSWVPKGMHREAFSRVPLAELGIVAPTTSLLLGMQPNRSLAKKIIENARLLAQQPFIVSVLAPFEAKHTSSLLDRDEMEIISARDNIALSVQAIDAGVRKIEEAMALGNRYIYVHCKSGIGRSATVIAAFLIKRGGLSSRAAIEVIKELRPHSPLQRQGNYHALALRAWKRWANLGEPKKRHHRQSTRAVRGLEKILEELGKGTKPEVMSRPWPGTLKVLVGDLWLQSGLSGPLPLSPEELEIRIR
jgi:hypothetical protein